MLKFFFVALIISLGGLLGPLQGQDPVCRNITTLNGLPSNTIYNILQDKDGFMWMGHDRGLCRYDGVHFTNYKANMRQGRSLSNLMQAAETVWAQDFAGNFYAASQDTLISQPLLSRQRSYYAIAAIMREKLMAAFSHDSLYLQDLITTSSKTLALPAKYQPAVLTTIDTLYFVVGKSLCAFDGASIKVLFSWPQQTPLFFHLARTSAGFVAFTKNTAPYAYTLEPGKATAVNILPGGTFIQNVSVIKNEVWISTTTGAYVFNAQLKPLYKGHIFFKNHNLSQVLCDKEGNYWFATLDKGILIVSNIHTRLYTFNNETISAMAHMDADRILLGTSSQQIVSFSKSTMAFAPLIKEPSNHEVIQIYYDSLQKRLIYCADNIVIAQNFEIESKIMVAGKCVAPLGNNQFAYVHSNGLGIFTQGKQQVSLASWLSSLTQGILRPNIRGRWVHYNSEDSLLLIATSIGLFYYSPADNGYVLYNSQPVYASGITKHQDKTFITTYNQGIFSIDSKKTLTSVYQPPHGKSIYKMLAEGDKIWMLSDEEIIQYNTNTKETEFFTLSNGLPKAEYKDFLKKNNDFYVATSEGLFVFDTRYAIPNTIAPSLKLSRFEVNGINVALKEKHNFKPNENNIHIDFSVLSFKHIEGLHIFYSINGGQQQVIAPGVRSINLPALSAGNYTLLINAANEDGIMSAEPIKISFYIEDVLYKKGWFITLVIASLLTAIIVWFKNRLKIVQRENAYKTQRLELEKELQHSKLSGIRSQMNPHFFYNALNTIQSYIYTNEKQQASAYLSKFSDLTRLILEMSTKDFISLADEVKALKLYLSLEAERFDEKLKYSIYIDDAIQPDMAQLPPMLIQPFVENSIKHGLLHSKNPWQLIISFIFTNGGIKVIIDDNGVGRKKSLQLNAVKRGNHKPFAISANMERLKLLNKGVNDQISCKIIDKYDEWGQATGTTVVLFIPPIHLFSSKKDNDNNGYL